ncbi:MAG: hypothetical protein E7351_01155 [Clostridiales bacterium]|nr:hypothetical protein [Clostridiales bacterium]
MNKIPEHQKNQNAKIHVMPPSITDEDISALFHGILSVVKKKIELEARAEIINMNVNMEKLLRELKERQAECIRLKNEILYLKSQIQNTD